MKLSNETLTVLKNFGTINPNLIFPKGNTLATIAEAKNIMANAVITEKFKSEFGIYDVNEFLNVISLVGTNPDLEFSDGHVLISEGGCSATYRFADVSILTAPKKKITMPDADVTLTLTAEQLSQVRRAAGALSHSVVSLYSDGSALSLVVKDPKNSSSNSFSIGIDTDESLEPFDLQFLISNLKMLSGDYTVEISSKLISKWILSGADIEYYIALEKTSTYGE